MNPLLVNKSHSAKVNSKQYRGGGGWDKALVSDCLPLAAPIGLLPLLILTLRGSERVLIVSMEPPDDLSCLTTPGGRPFKRWAVARAVDQVQGGGGGFWQGRISASPKFGALGTVAGNFGTPKFWRTMDTKSARPEVGSPY